MIGSVHSFISNNNKEFHMQVREARAPHGMWGALKEANPEFVLERQPYTEALCKVRVLLDHDVRVFGFVWEDLLDEKLAVLTVVTPAGVIKPIPGRLDQCAAPEADNAYFFSSDDIRAMRDLYLFADHNFTGCSNAIHLVVIADPTSEEEKGGLVLRNLLFRRKP